MRKIKLLFYSCLLGMSALPVQAKVITQSQAQTLAAKYINVGNSSKKQIFSAARKSGQQNAPSFYAFNDSKGKGFVLIAGDDCVSPVLGYSPSGQIDTDNLPPALQAWLQDVSTYISSHRAASNGTATLAQDAEQGSTTPTVVVAPLIKTKWYQLAPYNDMTPTIGGEHCLTGCVATAMAQVMKYYQWPKRGTNSIKYDTPKYDQKACDVDFSQSTYDWDNMLDVYGTRNDPNNFTCSEANRQAVAKLMSDAGSAVYMDYGVEAGSGANAPEILSAVTYYFGYDAQFYHKNDYTMKQWLSLIKNNLDNGCPLIYCGDTKLIFGLGSLSHCFIVDGYDSNNFLHVNWGWAGECDGYYTFYQFGADVDSYYSENMDFVKMTPNKSGIIEWDAACPLRMKVAGSQIKVNDEICGAGKMITGDVDILNADLDLYLISLIWNLYQGDIMLGYTADNGVFTTITSHSNAKIKADSNGFTQGTVRFHIGSDDVKDLADGSYQLVIRSKRTPSGMSVNGAPIVPAIHDEDYNLMLIKQNGKVSIGWRQKTMALLTSKSALTFDKAEYDITDMSKAKIKVANDTDLDFKGILQLIVTDSKGNSVSNPLTDEHILYGGDPDEWSFDIPVCSNNGFAEGTNKVSIGQEIDGKVVALKNMEPTTIQVNRNDAKIPVLEAKKIETEGMTFVSDGGYFLLDANAIPLMSADLVSHVQVVPEYCDMKAELIVTCDDGQILHTSESNIKDVVNIHNIAFELSNFSYEDVGKTGTIALQYTPMFDTKPHYVQYNGKDFCYKFKVGTTTGIYDVTNPQKTTERMRYDMMGRRINAPVKGLNIIKMSDGTVQKVIVKQ